MRHALRTALIVLAAAMATACSHMPDVGEMLPAASPQVTPDLSPRERVRLAVDMLSRGEARTAKAELEAALEEQPNMNTAQRLLEQIDGDPHALLGEGARPYTVRAGETMAQLSERYLGDPLLFYALSRYNNLAAPDQLAAGQTLMIPRRAGVTVASAPEPTLRGTANLPLGSAIAPTASVPPPPPSPTAARANQLRLTALQQLNGGNVSQAVTLLRQAQALDANNPAIQRDLDRALRLQASLNSSGQGTH